MSRSPSPGAVGACTDAGVARDHNEDCALALELESVASGRVGPVLVAAVADGMGGHSAGEVASRTAIGVFARTVQRSLSTLASAEPGLSQLTESAFEEANREVNQLGVAHSANSGMGTTLTTALFADGRLCIGHVGDSRAYLIRDGVARQLTRDHSIVQKKIDEGLLTAEEAARSEERNLLLRALGSRPIVLSDLIYEDLQAGDAVLLSTDGLHNSVSLQEIAAIITANPDPQAACERLVSCARARDGSDNITAVCIDLRTSSAGGTTMLLPAPKRASRLPLFLLLALVLLAMGFVGGQIWTQFRPVRSVIGPETPPSNPPATVSTSPPSSESGLELKLKVNGREAVATVVGELVSLQIDGISKPKEGRFTLRQSLVPQQVELTIRPIKEQRGLLVELRHYGPSPEKDSIYLNRRRVASRTAGSVSRLVVSFDGKEPKLNRYARNRIGFYLAGPEGTKDDIPVVVLLPAPEKPLPSVPALRAVKPKQAHVERKPRITVKAPKRATARQAASSQPPVSRPTARRRPAAEKGAAVSPVPTGAQQPSVVSPAKGTVESPAETTGAAPDAPNEPIVEPPPPPVAAPPTEPTGETPH